MSRPKSADEFARHYQRGDIVATYDRDRSRTLKHQVVRALEREFFCERVPTGGTVLELGVGTGEIAAAVSARGPMVGIDTSAAMLEFARARVPDARLRELSMFEIDQLGEQFAMIYTSRVFLHLDPNDLGVMLTRCAAQLAPGGVLVFDLQRPNPTKWLLDRLEPQKMFNFRYTRRAILKAISQVPSLRLKELVALEHMALLGFAALLPPLAAESGFARWLVTADRRLASLDFSANRWGVVCERI